MLFSTAVFAAPHFEVGTPIDLSTRENVTEYTEDTKDTTIAVPIYLYTDNDSDVVKNFGLSLIYDNTVLTPASASSFSYSDLGEKASNTNNLRGVYAIYSILDSEGTYGQLNYNKNDTTSMVGITATGINTELSGSDNGNTVLYFVFKITGTADDTVLNHELFKINEKTDVTAIKIGDDNEVKLTGTFTKANACDGAFQIVVNKDALPDNYFIQGIKVGDTALTAVVVNEDETVYKFPVRLIAKNSADATGNKTFAITASVSETEDGTATDVSWGNVTVAVDGSATSYGDAVSVDYGTTK
jgi:hypothetical protein